MARAGSSPEESVPGEAALGISRVSIVERAIQLLRKEIERGAWQVGDRLPTETELTKRFGISRAALREAVRALAHGGLLMTRQGAGTYVVAVDEAAVALNRRLEASAIEHVLEVRRGLDVEAVRLASKRRIGRDVKSMQRALTARRRSAESGDQRGFADADVAFHLAVAAAAHNDLLMDLYGSISQAIRQSVDSPASVAHVLHGEDDHDGLFEAIRDRDEERAMRMVMSILDGQLNDLYHATQRLPCA